MSFGSNRVDWVRSFQKMNCKFFRFNRGRNGPRGRVSHERLKLRKCTKHEFWFKQGGLGAFISKNSTASFFASTVGRTALGGGFRMSFINRNRNFENAPNMSFGSNGWIGCVRFEKIDYKFFRSASGQNGTRERVLHEVCLPKPKL
jgi:hypothetical protein